MTRPQDYKRRYLRSKPDPKDYVQIDLDPNREEFNFQHVGLLVEESPMGGCGIICLAEVGLTDERIVCLKVGRMAPLKAQVVWCRKLDEDVFRYGLKFLE